MFDVYMKIGLLTVGGGGGFVWGGVLPHPTASPRIKAEALIRPKRTLSDVADCMRSLIFTRITCRKDRREIRGWGRNKLPPLKKIGFGITDTQ
jgi:hypothetical protein